MRMWMRRLPALTAAFALLCPAPASAANLSPARWPEAERSRLEAREAAVMPAASRAVEGRSLVAGTGSPFAVRAADAAIATALTQVSDWTGANISYAGVAQLVYYDASSRRVFAMDAGWNSWRGETSPHTLPEPDLSAIVGGDSRSAGAAGRKVLVPGFMAGMEAAHRRFGRLAFGDLFQPAIWQAEQGIRLTALHAAWFGMGGKYLAQTPQGRRFAAGAGPAAPRAGDLFRQPELAAFLRDAARNGAAPMYRGAWARDFVSAVNAAGGHASLAEMRDYKVRWSEPMATDFAGSTVHGPGETNMSGCAVLEALNLIGHSAAPRPYWQDAASLRSVALATRAGQFAGAAPEAAAAIEKAAFGLGGSCRARLDPACGKAASGRIERLLQGEKTEEGHHSASVVAIDRWGNIAALVHSNNSPLWGETGIVVQGVAIPSPAPIYRHVLVRTRPGDRLASDMAPVIALRDGRPALAVAAIGVSVVQETVRLADALLRSGAEPATAMAAPPLLLNVDQSQSFATRAEIVPAGAYPPAMLDQLRAAGLKVEEVDAARALALRGTAVFGLAGEAGARSVEVPGVMGFAEAE